MEKNYFIPILLFILTISSKAQVVNGGFENVKPNLQVRNWGMNFLLPITINAETGETTQDNILFSSCIPAFTFATTDSSSGSYALEITNALNVTQNQVIAGKAVIFNNGEEDFPGWNQGVPVSPGEEVYMLGFDYKFNRLGNDIAQAQLTVFDIDSNELGKASVDITHSNTQFQYVYTPVNFISQGIPAFMNISFSMSKEGSTPTFGSTLIIDNVIVNFNTLKNIDFQASKFRIYPTVASQEINIVKGNTPNSNYTFRIINLEGQILNEQKRFISSDTETKIDISELKKGVYFIQTEGFTSKFIKK